MVACYPDTGTMPGPRIERVTVRGHQVVIIYDEPLTTADNSFHRMADQLRRTKEAMDDFGRKMKEIVKMGEVRVFKPLPRRRIPWSAPQFWPRKLTRPHQCLVTRWTLSASGIGEGRKAARNT